MNAREGMFAALPRRADSSPDDALRALGERVQALGFGRGERDIARFIERAREAGSSALHCASLDEAMRSIAEAARRIAASTGRPCRGVAAAHEVLLRAGLAEHLRQAGGSLRWVTDIDTGTGTPVAREQYAEADIGVTVGLAGLADSGAIVISSSQSESRSVSLLPSEHFALVPAKRILPSLLQAAPLLRSLAAPAGSSAATLVGGPSKTADIEKVLVTGVHGPASLTILVVDDID